MEMVLLEVRFMYPDFQFEKKESVKMVDFQHLLQVSELKNQNIYFHVKD